MAGLLITSRAAAVLLLAPALAVVAPGQGPFQENSVRCAITVDGSVGSAGAPASVARTINTLCVPVFPAVVLLEISSTEIGQPWDLVTVPLPPVSGSAPPGATLPDGQLLNLDLGAGFSALSAGQSLVIPGLGFPGAGVAATIGITVGLDTVLDLGLQGFVMTPAEPLGFRLGQATHLVVTDAPVAPVTTAAGPTQNEGTVVLDLTTAPTCWCTATGGIPFYGTVFSEMTISANGTVGFGGVPGGSIPDDDAARTGVPFVGLWTDFDPTEGGTIVASRPAPGVVRVDWVAVSYNLSSPFGNPVSGPPNSFGIEFDCGTGTVRIDGLQGVAPNPLIDPWADQLLGISPGTLLGATNPGVTPLAPGSSGSPALSTDMIYAFNDASVAGTGLLPAIAAGMSSITFVPSPTLAPNYDWIAQ